MAKSVSMGVLVVDDAGAPSEALVGIAEQTLGYFEDAVTTAEAALASGRGPSPDVLASVNTLTGTAFQTLSGISEETRRNLEAVIAQPAIARVEVLNEDGVRETIFITPGGAPRGRWGDSKVASYRSPVGRLAAIPVGQELEFHKPGIRGSIGVSQTYELTGRAQLHPTRVSGLWDSRDTVVEQLGSIPYTVICLRKLLETTPESGREEMKA